MLDRLIASLAGRGGSRIYEVVVVVVVVGVAVGLWQLRAPKQRTHWLRSLPFLPLRQALLSLSSYLSFSSSSSSSSLGTSN